MNWLARLIQPRNPAFWLIVALNGLSAVLAWLVRAYDLAFWPALVVATFAIGNAALGAWLTWRLLREPAR
jgi:hypothetical protein